MIDRYPTIHHIIDLKGSVQGRYNIPDSGALSEELRNKDAGNVLDKASILKTCEPIILMLDCTSPLVNNVW